MEDDKLQWMYKGLAGAVDKEDYLTGRKVDKTFELIQAEENPKKFDVQQSCVPDSLFAPPSASASTVTVDLVAKQREDPLAEIRKKQTEQRIQLLDNPVRMKHLKNLLETTLKCDNSDSESSSDSQRNKRKKKSKRKRRKSSSSSSDEKAKRYNRHEKKYKSIGSLDRRDKRDLDSYKWRSDSQRTNPGHHSSKPSQNRLYTSSKPSKTKLSAEELEKRRQEMMNNAVWREDQRAKNVKSFKEKEETESKNNETSKGAQFIKPLLSSISETDSIEKRIKQRIFTSQRSHKSMDTNFAKK